jgi:hypothetical protein
MVSRAGVADHWLILATGWLLHRTDETQLPVFVTVCNGTTVALLVSQILAVRKGSEMPITSAVAIWARHQLGRVVFCETGETTPPGCSSTADEAIPAAPTVAWRREPLGPAGALARILMATMRQTSAGPTSRERARANANLRLETIRLSSIL